MSCLSIIYDPDQYNKCLHNIAKGLKEASLWNGIGYYRYSCLPESQIPRLCILVIKILSTIGTDEDLQWRLRDFSHQLR